MRKIIPIMSIVLLFCVLLTGYATPVADRITFMTLAPSAAATEIVTDAPTQAPTAPVDRVSAQVNAPEHVSETFTSNSGKLTISIDADVTVPQAERVPVYAYNPRLFTSEEALRIAKAGFGDMAYTGDTAIQHEHREIGQHATYSTTYEHDLYTMYLDSVQTVTLSNGRDFPAYFFWVSETALPGNVIQWAEACFERRVGDGEPYYWIESTGHLRADDEPARGNRYSREEARQMADAAVASFAPEFTCVATAAVQAEIGESDNGAKIIMDSNQEAWCFYYTRGSFPLPITLEYTQPNDLYNNINPHELIYVIVSNDGIVNIEYEHPHEVSGVLQEDAALLPFDRIMEVVRSVMPLQWAMLEGQGRASAWINVDDIRLGYMRVRSKNDVNAYELIPVWDFFTSGYGWKNSDGTTSTHDYLLFHSMFTVNAIDGTVIDRSYGY